MGEGKEILKFWRRGRNKAVYRMYCTVLYCAVLCCAVLYCTVLYCTVLYCAVLYCAVLCCAVLYCTVLCCAVLCCTVLYCTYLGTKIDQSGDNTPEIKHRISQTRKDMSALNSVWWHKGGTKNRKLYIYQTVIQSILVYGAEVWQIPTREINKILSTEMDVLRRSARNQEWEE